MDIVFVSLTIVDLLTQCRDGFLMCVIDSFRGEYFFLSNFAPCVVEYGGVAYPSSEHLYVALKTHDNALRMHISTLSSAGRVKRFGRTLDVRSDWEAVKLSVMYFVLSLKFSPDSFVASLLLNTGDSSLIEGNMWHDQIWGDCRCSKRSECRVSGSNYLGQLLMLRRAELCGHVDLDGKIINTKNFVLVVDTNVGGVV